MTPDEGAVKSSMLTSRRQFLKTACAAGAGFAVTGSAWAGLVEPNAPIVERRAIRIPGLPTALEGLKIVAMSDFHLHPFTTVQQIARVVEMANALTPDLILLPGDYVCTDHNAIFELTPLFEKLNAKLGVFASMGNHDYAENGDITRYAFKLSTIPLLENTGVTLRKDGADFFLAGLASAWAAYPDLHAALAQRRGRIPTILSMHEPDYADRIAGLDAVDLQISGHSHGGQVRVPGVGALHLPSWGQKYDLGYYQVKNLNLYTMRGVGTIGVPLRFNCPPEITELTLTA
ncbi:MAG: metallophosphoesterase [Chthoniobacteraceae bacterium]